MNSKEQHIENVFQRMMEITGNNNGPICGCGGSCAAICTH